MPENALQAFRKAEDHLRAGKYPEALRGYLKVVRSVPEFYRARFRVADTLLNFKAHRAALQIYKNLAWHAIKSGQPLQGLVATKMASALDPSLTEIITVVAQLYSRDSDRIATKISPKPRRDVTAADILTPQTLPSGPALIELAAQEAAALPENVNFPDKLPPIPLFSALAEDAFGLVLEKLKLRRFVAGQKIIVEGQPGDSFFILAEGDVEVTQTTNGKTLTLARLHPGAVFGEMALISKAPRTATVSATCDCDLLELTRGSLEEEAQKLSSVTVALKEFTHERFLSNLTATSPVFKPFPRIVRSELIKHFKEFPCEPKDELIKEGEEGQGLFLILKGEILVTKNDGGQKIQLATLKEGDVFGEMALIQDLPTSATCTALASGELLFLPKRDFNALTARHPDLKAELLKITQTRAQKNQQALSAGNYELVEDDDLIML